MLLPRPKPRHFVYHPIFAKEEAEENDHHKIKFPRKRVYQKGKPLLLLILLAALVFYIISYLGRYRTPVKRSFEIENIQVVE
ncbi:hypothetical protein J7K19_12405 [bacterium]|nr:hypothetical protein [bacterium]